MKEEKPVRKCESCHKEVKRWTKAQASRQGDKLLCWSCWDAGHYFKEDGTIGNRLSLSYIIQQQKEAIERFNQMWNDPQALLARITYLEMHRFESSGTNTDKAWASFKLRAFGAD